MWIITEYLKIDEAFYDLWPGNQLINMRVKRDYDHKTRTIDGVKHSIDDEPYITYEENYEEFMGIRRMDTYVIATWYWRGKLHRELGPAVITAKFDPLYLRHRKCKTLVDLTRAMVSLEYYQHDRLHREDGQALIIDANRDANRDADGVKHGWRLYGWTVRPPKNARNELAHVEHIPKSITESKHFEHLPVGVLDDAVYCCSVGDPNVDYKSWVAEMTNGLPKELQPRTKPRVPSRDDIISVECQTYINMDFCINEVFHTNIIYNPNNDDDDGGVGTELW